MPRWVALFRGINVGGNNLLPMKELVADLEGLKCTSVRTYIQSGNVIFDAAGKNAQTLVTKIQTQVEQQHGFRPQVLLLSESDLQQAIEANPFPAATSDPKSLHFFFLAAAPTNPNLQALDLVKGPTEAYVLRSKVFYLYTPDGLGRSKMAVAVEKKLGVVATARNYRTVAKLAEMVAER